MRTPIRGALALLLAACSAGTGAPRPPELALGVDACDYCHMSVDDPHRAAQWVGRDGSVRTFDEPGCLLAWLQANPAAGGTGWVADEGGSGWVPAEAASYLRGGASTVMGFDVLAFRGAEAARARAAETGGRVVGWSTLRREGVADAHAH